MGAPKTLHEFVLTLLSDPDARTAFQLDPQGALHAAGLSDINALDVREAIPLVTDYVPVQAVSTLDSTGVTDLTSSVLRDDRDGAIHELSQVVQQVTLAAQVTGEVNLAAASTLAGTSGALSLGGSLVGSMSAPAGLDLFGSADTGGGMSAQHDVAHTIDSGVLSDPTQTVTDTTGSLTGTLSTVTSGLGAGTSGLGVDDLTHHVSDPLSGTVHGLTGTVTGTVSGVLGGDLLGGLGGITGTGDAGTDSHVLTHQDTSGGTDIGSAQHADSGLLGHLAPVTDTLNGAGVDTSGSHLLDIGHLF